MVQVLIEIDVEESNSNRMDAILWVNPVGAFMLMCLLGCLLISNEGSAIETELRMFSIMFAGKEFNCKICLACMTSE